MVNQYPRDTMGRYGDWNRGAGTVNWFDKRPRNAGDTVYVNTSEGYNLLVLSQPDGTSVINSIPEGTQLTYTGNRSQPVYLEGNDARNAGNYTYVEVRLPDGSTGWVVSDFVGDPPPERVRQQITQEPPQVREIVDQPIIPTRGTQVVDDPPVGGGGKPVESAVAVPKTVPNPRLALNPGPEVIPAPVPGLQPGTGGVPLQPDIIDLEPQPDGSWGMPRDPVNNPQGAGVPVPPLIPGFPGLTPGPAGGAVPLGGGVANPRLGLNPGPMGPQPIPMPSGPWPMPQGVPLPTPGWGQPPLFAQQQGVPYGTQGYGVNPTLSQPQMSYSREYLGIPYSGAEFNPYQTTVTGTQHQIGDPNQTNNVWDWMFSPWAQAAAIAAGGLARAGGQMGGAGTAWGGGMSWGGGMPGVRGGLAGMYR